MSKIAYVVGMVLSSASIVTTADADVTLPAVISSHMVLQREVRAPIWGVAAAGEKVTVRFRD